MPKGLKVLGEVKDKRANSFSKYPFLRLKQFGRGEDAEEDAKIARIRFFTGWGDDLTWGCFHSVMDTSRLGKKFRREIYCPRTEGEDVECQYCDSEDRDVAWSRIKYFFWVWVYEIYHAKRDKGKVWKKVEYLDDEYYLEPVNKLMILETGTGGRDNALENKFEAWHKRFKGLCDRDYDWCRSGVELETGYDLVPREDKTSLTKVQQKAKDELSDLEEVVIKKPKKKDTKAGKKNKKGEKKQPADEVDEIFGEEEPEEE